MLVCLCEKKIKIFPSNVKPMATFKITGDLKGCTERYRNNHTMNENDTKKVNNGDINWSSIFFIFFFVVFSVIAL